MAVNLCANYDEVFKFKDRGSVAGNVMLMHETLQYLEELRNRGKQVTSIAYDDSNDSYYAFRITYV